MKGLKKPCNLKKKFTKVPNRYYDEFRLKAEPGPQREILDVILRKTYGWNKNRAGISYGEFKRLTGYTHNTTISGAIQKIVGLGLVEIEETPQNKANIYNLRYEEEATNETHEGGMKEIEELDIDNGVTEKEKALAEVAGGTKEESPKKSKNKRKTFKEKPLENWNCNDILMYFGHKYTEKLELPYPAISGKHRKLAKILLEQGNYEVKQIIKAIDYYISNYDTEDYLPGDFPAWNIFYGYRDSIFPRALLGRKPEKKGKNSYREYEENLDGLDYAERVNKKEEESKQFAEIFGSGVI